MGGWCAIRLKALRNDFRGRKPQKTKKGTNETEEVGVFGGGERAGWEEEEEGEEEEGASEEERSVGAG